MLQRATSLRTRLLASATAILLLFIVLTGLALDRALDAYTRHAEFDRLQGLIYSLLGAADIGADGNMNVALSHIPAPRLQQPDSGLFGAIFRADGQPVWQSPSLLSSPANMAFPGVNQWRFSSDKGFSLGYGLEWLVGEKPQQIQRFTIAVTDLASPLQAETARLSHRLWVWLAAICALLLATLLALMYWGLKPLQAIRSNLDDIRSGKAKRLGVEVPDEIRPLTQSVNELIEHLERQQHRFRDALADLAHSLKTPLAVMRNTPAATDDTQLRQQLQRIDEIISYQLKRAASTGSAGLTAPIRVNRVLTRLQRALSKVYADKGLSFSNLVPDSFQLRISEDDLMELTGNLLDNAAKYGRSQVTTLAQGNALVIDDDGDGFPADTEALLRRGQRADRRQPGQGIGLAVVDDIARAWGLKLLLTKNEQGGGRVVIMPNGDAEAYPD